MPSLEEACRIIVSKVKPVGVERVDLHCALGRVLAQDVRAPWDLPHYPNSARDGFAVRTADCTAEASTLRISGFIPAGGEVSPPVLGGCAIRIMTGAPIPHNCDAVVPVEDTAESEGEVTVLAPVRLRQFIRYQGEEMATGDVIVAAGTPIQSQEIGALASFGRAVVTVYQKVRVAVVSSGDELIELGDLPTPGRIINSNAQYLAAALREIGAEPLILSIARDNMKSLREQILAGLKADVLITTAGVASGDRDYVRRVLAELGVHQLLWKIDMKPGGPKSFGMKGQLPVFSLPGNPVSTMITFEEFVRPALLRMMGHRRVLRPTVKAILREETLKKPGHLHCMPVHVALEEGRHVATVSCGLSCGNLPIMLAGNAIAMLPKEPSVVPAGAEVEVHLLRGDLALLQEPLSAEEEPSSEREPTLGKLLRVRF